MTNRKDMELDQDLDALFAQAALDTPVPSTALMARILADADAEIEARGVPVPDWAKTPAARPSERHPMIKAALVALGGWRGVSGLVTATAAGLMIGFGAPGAVSDLTSGTWGDTEWVATESASLTYDLDDLVPSFYDLATEG